MVLTQANESHAYDKTKFLAPRHCTTQNHIRNFYDHSSDEKKSIFIRHSPHHNKINSFRLNWFNRIEIERATDERPESKGGSSIKSTKCRRERISWTLETQQRNSKPSRRPKRRRRRRWLRSRVDSSRWRQKKHKRASENDSISCWTTTSVCGKLHTLTQSLMLMRMENWNRKERGMEWNGARQRESKERRNKSIRTWRKEWNNILHRHHHHQHERVVHSLLSSGYGVELLLLLFCDGRGFVAF